MTWLEEVGRNLLGRAGQSFGSIKAGIKVEVTELKKLNRELDVVRNSVSSLRDEMDKLAASSQAAMNAARGATGGGIAKNGMPLGINTSQPIKPAFKSPAAALSGGNAGGGATPPGGGAFANFGGRGAAATALGAYAAGQLASGLMSSLDARIDRGAEYAANLDRLNVVMQQQTGMSQMQVMNQVRKPLTEARLGAGGINAIVKFQTDYGYQMGAQGAQSIAGIRALSGYQKTTADVLADQKSMMAPEAANRMMMMLGTNAYTYNGQMKDPMRARQDIVSAMGLTNEAILKSAQGMGSVTRARMADAGLSTEMQDELLSYAKANLTFQKKGGKGSYDPSNKEHRKLMGIEENFATQQEETDRLRTAREENFSRRQLDNLASMERHTQTMVKILGSIEDKLSGLVGARTSNRPWWKAGGGLLKAAGAITMATAGWTGVGAGVGAAMYVGGSAMSGDPDGEGSSGGTTTANKGSDSSRDGSIAIPVGYNGKRATLNEVKQRSDFKKLNPKMQERLLSMFRANPNVGIGGGFRDSASQEQMFKQRYRRTSEKTNIFWDGSYWEHVSGAAAAPPGRSMHEIGLAADLVGDLKWMNANAAKFGLKHFAGVNNEPWHVQPSELPNSRKKYEEGGAQWGTDGGFAGGDRTDSPVVTGADSSSDHSSSSSPGGGSIGGFSMFSGIGMSISKIIAAIQGGVSLSGGGQLFNSQREAMTAGGGTSTSMGGEVISGSNGALAGEQVARVAHRAGFRGDDLVKMIAIAKRESRWNPRAYNGNLNTGDQSYGLWQLNTLNSKKGGQMGKLVNSILGLPPDNKNFDGLFDPQTNANVAYEFYKRNGNTLRPWGGYKGQSNTHGADQYLAEATQAVQKAGLGDPYSTEHAPAPGARSGSVSVSHAPSYQITVAPTIHFNGSPASPDLKRIAQEVGSLLREEVRTLELRGA